MRHPVERERGRKYIGVPEFAQTGERILSELQLEQERGTVTNVPDERTIRYYLAEGLIQTPEERQGTASVFSYMNLLQLLTVKKLQTEHLPIRKIRELVADKSEQELETLLGVGTTSVEKRAPARESEARRYLESLLTQSKAKGLGSVVAGRTTQSPPQQMLASAAAPPPNHESEQTQSWDRVEIEPGLELHIRSDYTAPETSARKKSLAERVLQKLQTVVRSESQRKQK